MSLLTKLFGIGGKGGTPPTAQEAIQRLRETEEMLTKKQDFLEKKIDQELATAKKNGTRNKRGKGEARECVGSDAFATQLTSSVVSPQANHDRLPT